MATANGRYTEETKARSKLMAIIIIAIAIGAIAGNRIAMNFCKKDYFNALAWFMVLVLYLIRVAIK